MKKVSVIVQSKDAHDAVGKLAKLGVVHIEHENPPAGDSVNTLRDKIAVADKAIGMLDAIKPEHFTENAKDPELFNWNTEIKHILDLDDRKHHLLRYSSTVEAIISEWKDWGEFDPDSVRALKEKGIYVKLYRVPAREMKKIPKEITVKCVSSKGGMVNCAVFSRDDAKIPFKELELPKMSLKKAQERLEEDKKVRKEIEEDLYKSLSFLKGLKKLKRLLAKKLELEETLNGMGLAAPLSYLRGYAPQDEVKKIQSAAKKERWGVFIEDPADDDKVPTLIRNPKWVSIIAPVFKVIDIVPGYRELDISFWFLAFLSVFFGMLIGDAAYGGIFFILTLFANIKFGKKVKEKSVFTLLYLLSLAAITWGVLTGTFFGQAWLEGSSLKPLVPALKDPKTVQAFCFLLGALQLSIAHLWRALRKLPSLAALGDIGWVSVLCGAFFLARTLILGKPFPAFGKWFFMAGPILVVLFSSPKKNVFKGIGAGLGTLLLNFVNSFTDIVSYIRLFAVGLATVAIADAFNAMAMGIGFKSIVTGFFTALILVLGHTLNIILGPLAVLVHGVRLNVLEFCNHLDIKWSGFSYKPLKTESK